MEGGKTVKRSKKLMCFVNGSPSDDKVIIALDFGTTYSGIAYLLPGRGNEPCVIENWPGTEGVSTLKVPTLIRYDKRKDPTGFDWGAAVGRHSGDAINVNHVLDPTQSPKYHPVRNIETDTNALPKPSTEVAADFIGAMYKHALAEIRKAHPKEELNSDRRDYVITTPDAWSDAAKKATLEAAGITGIKKVSLVKGSDASAIHVAASQYFNLKRNDAFVVCDAGGCSVDLVSCQVKGKGSKLELVSRKSSMVGSMGLNYSFAAAVTDLVGEEQWLSLKNSGAFLHAEGQFEQEIKTTFRDKKGLEYLVKFPKAGLKDDPANGLVSDCWTMTNDDLDDIFGPNTDDVLELVDQQVTAVKRMRGDNSVKGIFLVGGFGSSKHLKDRIESEHPTIPVFQPDDASTAIVKGAVWPTVPREVAIIGISATRNYGIELDTLHDKIIDQGQPSIRDIRGDMKTKRMRWYFKVGDHLSIGQKVKFCSLMLWIYDYELNCPRVFTHQLYQCKDMNAPVHRSKCKTVDVNCTLTSHLRDLPRCNFVKRATQCGTRYWDIHFDLILTVVSLDPPVMKFSVEMDGKEISSVDSKFE